MLYEALQYWQTVFTQVFITAMSTNDLLRMSVVQKAPFQDDPTRKAPYLVLFGGEHGIQLASDTDVPMEGQGAIAVPQEVGGPTYWTVDLGLKAAPRVQTDSDSAYRLVSLLTERCLHVLQDHALDTYEASNGGTFGGIHWNPVYHLLPHVYGGEREWLSYTTIRFYTLLRVPYRVGTFPPSAF